MTMKNNAQKSIKDHFLKWWIIYGGIFISFSILIWGFVESKGFPDEKFITAAAFLMFISTAILQNRELSYQREDVRLNREALMQQVTELKFQRDELEKQTSEFQETNKYNKESLEITQFFEILRLREDVYNDVLSKNSFLQDQYGVLDYYRYNEYVSEDNNYIEQFNVVVMKVVLDKIFVKSNPNQKSFDPKIGIGHNEKEKMRENYEELIKEKSLLDAIIFNAPERLVKLYTINKILDNLVHESEEGTSIFSDAFKNIGKSLRQAFKIKPGERYNRSDIYEMIVSEPEENLRKIIDNEIEFEDVLKIGT